VRAIVDDIGEPQEFYVEVIYSLDGSGMSKKLPAHRDDQQAKDGGYNKQNGGNVSKGNVVRQPSWKASRCIRPSDKENQHRQK
jgi:hypothetical protein